MMIENYYKTCTRLRIVTVLNERNRPVKSYQGTPINGFIGTHSNSLKFLAGKTSQEINYNFLCDDFDLKLHDCIIYNNSTYKVVSPPHNTANKNHHIQCKIRQINDITDWR